MSDLRSIVLACCLLACPALTQVPGGLGLPWSVFLGGSGFEECEQWNQVCLARNGDVLVCGRTYSANFPYTTGSGLQGVEDGFVVRMRSGAIVWATLIGGSGRDAVRAVLEDRNGDVLIAGRTSSTNFPTVGALQPAYGGGSTAYGDGFVARLTNAISGPPTVTWATYLGGAGDDAAVTLAEIGDCSWWAVVVGGWTASTNFPLPSTSTPSPFQQVHHGPLPPGPGQLGADGFVAVLAPGSVGASQLIAATYLGGNGDDVVTDVATQLYCIQPCSGGGDACISSIVVSGRTMSSNFPTTAGAYDNTLGGPMDAFVAALDSRLSFLGVGTYLGGDGIDVPYGMATMGYYNSGEVVVGGETTSTNFPTTPGALQSSFAGGSYFGDDAFVARLDLSQTGSAQLAWATYLGGPGDDALMDLAIERSGMITAVGLAGANPPLVQPFPWITPGALQTTFQGGGGPPIGPTDGFVVRLDPSQNSAAQLIYGTFLGGSQGQENAMDVALTATGSAVVVGWTWSANFPATGTYQGNSDVFVAELDMLPAGVVRYGAPSPLSPGCRYPTHLSVNSQPLPGNTSFEIHVNEAPPGSFGALFLGTPVSSPLPVLGIDAWLSLAQPPLVMNGFANVLGFARFPLPIPVHLAWPFGGFQSVWLHFPTLYCSLVASDALR